MAKEEYDADGIRKDLKRKARVRIIVAAHKAFPMPADQMYVPLHVGAEGKTDKNGNPLDLGFQKDNTGDNISDRNPQFCELTGLYWAWKNLNADYLGLVHYRRHFAGKRALPGDRKDPFDRVLTYRELRPMLDKYSVFVPEKRHYYIETLYQHYAHNHHIEELDTAYRIMMEKYPEYESAYHTAINRTWGYMFNMMILRYDLMDDYCSWLFDILFELTDRLSEPEGTAFENRFPGRVSERLFNVWLTYQLETGKIKESDIKEIPFMYMEHINVLNKGVTFLEAKFLGKKPEKSF